MTNKPSHTKPIAFIAILTALAALALVAASASAAVGPQWRLDSLADTSVAPGEDLTFYLQATNVGDTAMDGTDVAVKATLPAGMTAKEAVLQPNAFDEPFNKVVCFAGDGVSPVAGATSVKCTSSFALPISPNNANYFEMMTLKVHLDPAAQGTPTVRFGIEGGGALTVEKADPTLVTDQPPAFDIDAFDGRLGDGSGAVLTQAGAHPSEATVFMDLTSHTDPRPLHGDASPVEPLKDVVVDLPPGLVGNPTVADTCTSVELAFGEITPLPKCPVTSQVGVVSLGMNNRPSSRVSFGEVSVYNLVPPPGAPARFGFNVGGTVTVLDAGVRSDGDYGLSVSVKNASEGLGVVGSEFTFWGVPSDPAHDLERSCPGEFQLYGGGPSCPSPAPQTAFMRNTTACTPAGVGLHSSVRVDSWFDPGDFKQASFTSHEDPGFPALPSEWGAPVGPSGCEEEPFSPSLDAQPGANRTDSPSGFAFDLQMPQEGFEDPEAVSESDLRKAVVTLPAGVRLNPSSADGLGACSPAQVAMSTAVGDPNAHFKTEQTACPESAKLGSLSIKTPLLGHEVPGAVYLAEPLQNPFGSLIALYLVADDPATGVRIVLAGKVDLDPQSGQITTSFDQNPQLPFETLHLSLDTGPRAALALPNACGTYTTHSAFLGWSGAQATSESSFTIKEGCDAGGFDPHLSAGTQNPLAATFSPFSLRLTREDGGQELGGLRITLPPGLIGAPKGIPYCPESALASFPAETILGAGAGEIAAPKCPAASQLGTVTVGAGAGPTPFYTVAGKAYLAGPYKGAPLSLAVLAPALAGPFDLGTVLVRNALRVDPESTQVTAVSDPLPSILHGIPLDLRDVRVNLNRPSFTLNPTSCEPLRIASQITSTRGAVASPSAHFQVAGCDRLGFKPKLSLKLKGGVKRSEHPALTAVLTARKGDANIARTVVALPHSEFLAQSHIRTICTRVQFAAGGGGGEQCPKGSVYGKVTATSPLVGYPLSGNVYLRSSSHPLPDLVLALHGPASQPLQVEAVGRIDSKGGGIRTTFASVPDAPLTKVVLKLPGGKKSLLENSTNLCRSTNKASVQMSAHSAKLAASTPELKVKCSKSGKGGKRHRSAYQK